MICKVQTEVVSRILSIDICILQCYPSLSPAGPKMFSKLHIYNIGDGSSANFSPSEPFPQVCFLFHSSPTSVQSLSFYPTSPPPLFLSPPPPFLSPWTLSLSTLAPQSPCSSSWALVEEASHPASSSCLVVSWLMRKPRCLPSGLSPGC